MQRELESPVGLSKFASQTGSLNLRGRNASNDDGKEKNRIEEDKVEPHSAASRRTLKNLTS